MDARTTFLLIVCIAVLLGTGCTSPNVPAANQTPSADTATSTPAVTQNADCTRDADCVPAECCHATSCTAEAVKRPCNLMCTQGCQGPLDCGAGSCGCVNGKCRVIPATPAATVSPVQPVACTRDADCVPAECCHATSCTAEAAKRPCNLLCTLVCSGPLDCGAGSCGCVDGNCSIIPASSASLNPTRLSVVASPQRYSPVMSSTPGIGLEPVITGFSADNATFAWKATYGYFLSWNSPDYRINQLGGTATNRGQKLYWSFMDSPASTATPVTITVLATDTGSGRLLGSSTVTLAWEGNTTVIVDTVE